MLVKARKCFKNLCLQGLMGLGESVGPGSEDTGCGGFWSRGNLKGTMYEWFGVGCNVKEEVGLTTRHTDKGGRYMEGEIGVSRGDRC